MSRTFDDLRRNPLYWLVVFVPVVFVTEMLRPESHTPVFLLSVVAIVPLAGLLSHATESVAAKTGDAIGGLLNATLGNLTELVIAIAALRAGMFDLVKASLVGAIVTNSLFMLGAARSSSAASGTTSRSSTRATRESGRNAAARLDRPAHHVGHCRIDHLNVAAFMLPLAPRPV